MEITKIHVSGFTAQVMSRQPLVSGTVGMPVEFTFGEDWQDLKKTAVFRCDEITYTVLDLKDTALIPWELLRNPGCTLKAGVYGTSEDGSVQIPTMWAELGKIQEGADPSGDQSADPTLPVWQQLSDRLDADAMKKIADTDLNMNGYFIHNVSDGVQNNDAATVGQLNATVGDIENALDSMTRNYELIETITLTEETTLIERTEEPDGTTYNFKDVFIVVSGGETTISGQWILWKVWFGNEAIETFRNTVIGIYNKTLLSSKTDGNLRQLLFGLSSTNYRQANTALSENILYLFTNENISKMTFQHQTAMPAGTKIDIYAVRG